jgi:hypothetical protein
MKKKIIMETLVAAAFAVSAQVQAAPISLSNANITATYNGTNQIGHFSQDYAAGANTGGLDPNGAYVEFATVGNLFNFDFDSTGLLTTYAAMPLDTNGNPVLPDANGSYKVRFDFGTSLAAAIGGFALVDGGADGIVGGMPVLSVIDSHTIELDLSKLVWNDQFIPLVAQITAPDANVPEPASLGLLLAGAAGVAATRRRRA